jgi:hypothetical protein
MKKKTRKQFKVYKMSIKINKIKKAHGKTFIFYNKYINLKI